MKTLERNFGVTIGWNHDRVKSGDYILIHTRSSHMSADIYTKGFRAPDVYKRLKRLINIYTPEEILNFWFSPVVSSYPPAECEGVVIDPTHLNPHYTYIMSGESDLNTDFRKPVRVKPQKKAKPKPKFKIQCSVSSDGFANDDLYVDEVGRSGGGVIAVLNAESIVERAPEILTIPPSDLVYHLILLCTEENSFLDLCNPFPDNCVIHHITVSDDFTSSFGYRKVADIVQSNRNVAILVSFPCTGGCLFNAGINAHNPKCQDKIEGHWVLFRKLWKQLERLLRQFGDLPIIQEWPRSCLY